MRCVESVRRRNIKCGVLSFWILWFTLILVLRLCAVIVSSFLWPCTAHFYTAKTGHLKCCVYKWRQTCCTQRALFISPPSTSLDCSLLSALSLLSSHAPSPANRPLLLVCSSVFEIHLCLVHRFFFVSVLDTLLCHHQEADYLKNLDVDGIKKITVSKKKGATRGEKRCGDSGTVAKIVSGSGIVINSKIVVSLAACSVLSARCFVFYLLLSISVSLRPLWSALVLVCEAHVLVLLRVDTFSFSRSLFVVVFWLRLPVHFCVLCSSCCFDKMLNRFGLFVSCVFSSTITTVCSLSEWGVAVKYRCH